MKAKWVLIAMAISLVCLCCWGCGEDDTTGDPSYLGFLELPGFDKYGEDYYPMIENKAKTDTELKEENYSEEDIAAIRAYDLDDAIKYLAALPYQDFEANGATLNEVYTFKKYVDDFYGEAVSKYPLIDLAQLSDEEIMALGYSAEKVQEIRERAYAIENSSSLTDEELKNYGFTQEEIDSLREYPQSN
ncbi:MAG: hypothetical protein Q4C00_07660 [Bacillota bacterium]|nr:hypothetical protein [Bacillota bacterium]